MENSRLVDRITQVSEGRTVVYTLVRQGEKYTVKSEGREDFSFLRNQPGVLSALVSNLGTQVGTAVSKAQAYDW